MRQDPADEHWLGRDRFVLSAGHSSLTQYIQLYLAGMRPGAGGPRGAAHLGLEDPRPPRVPPHQGRRDDHRPAGPGHRLRRRHGDGRPPRAGPARPRRRPRHQPVRPPHLRHRLRRRPRGGRERRGLLARRHPAAGQPRRHLRRQPHLHRGRHQHRLHRGRARPLRRVRLAHPARGLDARRHGVRRGRPRRSAPPSRPPRPRPAARRSSRCAPSSAGPPPNKQNTGAIHGSALGADEVAAVKKVLGFDPEKSFEVADDVIAHTRGNAAARAAAAREPWDAAFAAWREQHPDAAALLDRLRARALPEGWEARAARPSRPARP